MFEIMFMAVLVGTMAKIADIMNRRALVWGGITAGLCVVSLVVPWPFLRVFIVGAIIFVSMFVAEFVRPTQN